MFAHEVVRLGLITVMIGRQAKTTFRICDTHLRDHDPKDGSADRRGNVSAFNQHRRIML